MSVVVWGRNIERGNEVVLQIDTSDNARKEGVLSPRETNSEKVIDEVLSSNIKAIVLFFKHVLPEMVKQGHGVIVNTASCVGTTMPLPIAVV